MAKAQTQTQTSQKAPKFSVPEGYSKNSVSGDIVAFWDDEVAGIEAVFKAYKLFDNDQNTEQVSTLFICELLSPLQGAYKKEKGKDKPKVPVQTKKGDLVGVWGSAGMRDLVNMGGVPLFMYQDGEKDTGKKSPMKLYHIHPKEDDAKGSRLQCLEDGRKESINAKLLWEKKGVKIPSSDTNGSVGDEDLDNLPM